VLSTNFPLQKIFSLLFIFITSLFLFPPLLAQQYHFDNYGVKEGLSQSSVYVVSQGKDAMLWLGTGAGISSFDGKDFVNYTSDDGLAEGSVKALLTDTLGNVWSGHSGGGVSLIQNNKAKILFNFT